MCLVCLLSVFNGFIFGLCEEKIWYIGGIYKVFIVFIEFFERELKIELNKDD